MNDLAKGTIEALSPREREVLGLAAAGLVDKQIGQELNLSLNTLRTYWARIRDKLGRETRSALVAAYVSGEILPETGITFDPRVHQGWVMDARTHMVLATDGINRIHELEPGVPHHASEYMGHTHPEDAQRVYDLVMEIAKGKRDALHIVFRTVSAQGVELVNTTVHSVKNRAGVVTKVYGLRVQALDCRPGRNPLVQVGHWEEEDFESETFLVDEGFAQIFGLPDAGVVHRRDINWKRHPEDSERLGRECLLAVRERREHLTTDSRHILADGRVVWGRARRRFVYENDGRVRIFGTFAEFE